METSKRSWARKSNSPLKEAKRRRKERHNDLIEQIFHHFDIGMARSGVHVAAVEVEAEGDEVVEEGDVAAFRRFEAVGPPFLHHISQYSTRNIESMIIRQNIA